jgi:hypothetical protein
MEADSSGKQGKSPGPVEDIELLDELSMAAAYLWAAEGPDAIPWVFAYFDPVPGRPWSYPWHRVPADHSASAGELRSMAIGCFVRAAQLRSDEPWIWFQIGWNSFAFEDGPCDHELARTALTRALSLDPNNWMAHLAMAWLHQQEAHSKDLQDTEQLEVTRQDPVREHLGRVFAQNKLQDWAELKLSRGSVECYYLLTRGSRSVAFDALNALEGIVPDDNRFAYYETCGDLAVDGLRREYYEAALKWPTSDPLRLLRVHWGIAAQTKHNLERSLQYYLKAYEYLTQLSEEDISKLYPDLYPDWLCDVKGRLEGNQDRITTQVLPLLQEITNVGLEMVDKGWISKTDATSSDILGLFVAITGRLLFEEHDSVQVRKYLAIAEQFDRQLEETWNDQFDEPYFEVHERSPDNWRVVTARYQRDICIGESDWAKASHYNNRILELLSSDRDALQIKPLIESNARAEHANALVTHQLDVLLFKTDTLLSEVSLQRSAAEQLSHIRQELADPAKYGAMTSEQVSDLVGQLHNLVQRGSQIQPMAWQRAGDSLRSELGPDVFSRLKQDSQHFLTTAEVFHASSTDVASMIDAALIAVEYAKVVETELRLSFLPGLASILEMRNYKGSIKTSSREIPHRGPGTWNRILPEQTLGESAAILKFATDGTANEPVAKILDDIGLVPEWCRKLAGELARAVKYRNGAAHIESCSRETIVEFRKLLIQDGLLKRILELGEGIRRAVPSQPEPMSVRRGKR